MKEQNNNIQALEQQIATINEIVNELNKKQAEVIELLHKNHITYMKKLDKLQEFNKISDMTNQVFERRLSEIERNLKRKE